MRTKAQLVEEILSIEEVDTKSNLMKKSLAKLESILSDLEGQLVSQEPQAALEPQATTQAAPQVDIQALMEQMKKEMLAELKEQARKEVEAEQKSAETATTPTMAKPVSQKKEIDRFENIAVMNVTNGTLVYTSRKTGAEWIFSEYGDIEYMEFQELLTMRSSQRRFFDEPFLLIMDDNAVEHLGLTKMYENIRNPEQIDTIFKMNQREFEDVVEKSPKGIKHLIVSRAKRLYEIGELDSVKKINYLNERFQTDIGQRG
ncbi:cell envelope integrity protein TolA [Paenibacillus sp. Mc5Re-14]|uniref:cell envelope integrity protein TolA n=1 Tax=Paenibacillus sp. Mc5Re-14 TaxID=1030529 RepID=UPI000AA0A618|nr:cell envelope integrity protein TolA [Paenibacillus sp. Mc5Re-14]